MMMNHEKVVLHKNRSLRIAFAKNYLLTFAFYILILKNAANGTTPSFPFSPASGFVCPG